MTSYYNDNDPTAAAWLRELIAAGLIPQGDVDDRSILEIEPADLVGYDHVHFFAGIGGWAYALRLVGWPDDRPVWTGSPPCQPFSVAGKQLGKDDARHLAPHFLELVTACRPPVLFGEQVASSQVFGKVAGGAGKCVGAEPEWAWIDDVSLHLEEAHYAFGTSDLPAASVGAPHQRQRCFFGAYDLRSISTMVNAEREQRQRRRAGEEVSEPGEIERAERRGDADWLANSDDAGPQGRAVLPERGDQRPAEAGGLAVEQPAAGPTNGFWRDADWLFCTDDKWRPVEPGTQPLAHGVSDRVALLRGAGNAIVPEVAAEFIIAFEEARSLTCES